MWRPLRYGVSALALLALVCAAQPLPGQDEKDGEPKKVKFQTADGVEIIGSYYATSERDKPCVLLLHALGEDRTKKGWDTLARELNQKGKGFAVLSFDFRGHGESTSIDPQEFWLPQYQVNRVLARSFGKNAIDQKEFPRTYYPVLLNDIAAAKVFLDRKNDEKECNSSALILIGADTGATLGALWLNSEFYRYRLFPPQLASSPPRLDKAPQGKKVAACVWLNISRTTIAQNHPNVANLLYMPARLNATPMLFVQSAEDTKEVEAAKALEKVLKDTKDKERFKFTGIFSIDGAAKLHGRELLDKSLNTAESVNTWLKEAVKDAAPWEAREFNQSIFIWQMGAQAVPAKGNADQLLRFNTYTSFLK